MTAALCLFVFTVGAIFTFAVHAEPASIDFTAVGVILMAVSAFAFVLAIGRDFWRDRVYQERVRQGTAPPMPIDHSLLVDRDAPIEGERHSTGGAWRHDPTTDAWHRERDEGRSGADGPLGADDRGARGASHAASRGEHTETRA
ncbi:hypothetical protein [Pseudofrankia saprophytica]|nr:hypothetical protein [Pseudofrankia saprophytica]